KVSVIIPCLNEGRTIRLLLQALYDQTFDHQKMEIVIADGMSQDNTRNEIMDFTDSHKNLSIRVIDNPTKTIPSGLNHAIQASTGEILIRMDAHSIPQPDYVERCVTALEENKGDNVGGVWDIKSQTDTWLARSIAAAASHPLAVGDAHYRFTDKAGFVDTVPFGAFKRSVVNNIGGFDETLLTNEDYEFNTRLRQSGGKIWLDPQIRSAYFARKNLSELSTQYQRYGFWKAQMLKRYPNTLRWRQALPPVFVLSLLIFAIAGIFVPLVHYIFLAEVILYLLILILVGIQVAFKQKKFGMILGIPLAISTMHLSWGTGFLRGIFSRASTQKA
ncbi:MAG: glycosyltransferase family 2 protein, partial [Anaerolineaceae bacterium]|nr:glycosyltransferase family 2 protein [Anaerolineaceae bacterium]